MQPIYKGIPELFEYVIGLEERRPKRDIESIIVFNLLRKILSATEHAIIHYFTLTLSEPFLQNSQHGSPYQKWALVTNENFQRVDQYVKSLKPLSFLQKCFELGGNPRLGPVQTVFTEKPRYRSIQDACFFMFLTYYTLEVVFSLFDNQQPVTLSN